MGCIFPPSLPHVPSFDSVMAEVKYITQVTRTEPLNEDGSPPTSRSSNSEARDGGKDGPDNLKNTQTLTLAGGLQFPTKIFLI